MVNMGGGVSASSSTLNLRGIMKAPVGEFSYFHAEALILKVSHNLDKRICSLVSSGFH